jgi:GDP-L-fucose synthase
MKVFFTGGRGFFGRVLKRKFEEGGHSVVAPTSKEVDLMNGAEVDDAVAAASPDLLVHSAAYYGGIGINQDEPDNLFHLNTVMVANVYHAAAKAEVPKVQGIGSACAYPGKTTGDLKEEDFWEGELHHSVIAYGFSKKLQEVAMAAYNKKYGMKGQLPLLTNLYGEHDVFTEYRSHVVSALIKRYADATEQNLPYLMNWGTGSPIREFMYVEDAAEACHRLAMTDYEGRLNIGTGIGTSIKELAELTAKHTGFKGEVRWDPEKPDGVARKILDVTKMKDVLKWEPPHDLDSGLKKTIDWYLANKDEADARP